MKLVAYSRVSTDGQAENTSLGEQQKRIRAYCEAFSHELIGEFEEVGSGANTKRPQFQQALQLVRDRAEGIIAFKLDRIARNAKDVLVLVEDVLQPHGKALVLLDLNVDTSTPIGKMILTVMAAVAELERNTIYERCQNGRRAKAAKGGYAYGRPHYGQKVVNRELAPDPEQIKVARIICNHRRSGKSYHAIARWLNQQGIPARQGGRWYAQSVKNVCRSPLFS